MPAPSSGVPLLVPSPCAPGRARLWQARAAQTYLVHHLESPGPRATVALDVFQCRSVEPSFPRGTCSLLQVNGSKLMLSTTPPLPLPLPAHRLLSLGRAGFVKGWRVMSWGPGPKDSTVEPEPMWRDERRGKSIHTPHASISPLYDQTLSVYRFLKNFF